MTNNHDEPFYPERVDEQIGQLSQGTPQSPHHTTPDMRMIQDLRTISTDYTRSGERVRSRLAAHMARRDATSSGGFHTREGFSQEGMRFMQTPYPTDDHAKGNIRKRISLIAATLVAALLVGLLVATLTLGHNHQGPAVATGQTPTPTATATPVPPGTIVHTQSSAPGTNLWPWAAWSLDGTRVATVSANLQSKQDQLQIWDATTGGHLVSIPLDASASFSTILWSPTGKYLALVSLPLIEIVDSQTGALVKNIPFNSTTASVPALTGQVPLSSFINDAGGVGFYAATWTPDGTSLAVANSYSTTTGNVELLNPVTGAVNKTFTTDASSIGGPLAFSSDGQYLAASYVDASRVVVWNVATKAVVFKQENVQMTNIAWQPGTYHLAEEVGFPVEVQLWDIQANKVIKTFPGITDFTWSPDGKKLATWVDPIEALHLQNTKQQTGEITIINASSGSQVAVYTSPNSMIEDVAWSPDGRYIASAESPPFGQNGQNRILIRAV